MTSLLQMERQVLDVLAFRINSPTPYTFWRFFRHINPMQPATASLASYLTVRPSATVSAGGATPPALLMS